jgi:DNA-directed RNA polymerase specialized sigma24 family protein
MERRIPKEDEIRRIAELYGKRKNKEVIRRWKKDLLRLLELEGDEYTLASLRLMARTWGKPEFADFTYHECLREYIMHYHLYLHLEKLPSAVAVVVALYRNSPSLTNKEIADKLDCTPNTVKSHFKTALDRIGVPTRDGLDARHGLLIVR